VPQNYVEQPNRRTARSSGSGGASEWSRGCERQKRAPAATRRTCASSTQIREDDPERFDVLVVEPE
jgi:hypothetical protein